MSAPKDQAERLKAEGNALFIQNDFEGAYKKYTEAIKHDDKNAVLYSNRAACAFGLNRYDEAASHPPRPPVTDWSNKVPGLLHGCY